MRLAVRAVIVVVLVMALLGLCVHYGGTSDENWPHPTGDQLQDDYDAYAGDRVLVFGDVQSVDRDAGTIVIHVTDSADDVAAELEISDAATAVEPGGTVQVYGVLEDDRTMTADRTVVVDRDATAFRYKLLASVVGALLAVGSFLRYWTLDPRAVAFEPRSNTPDRPSTPTTGSAPEGDRDG